jgi:hypothetical protein
VVSIGESVAIEPHEDGSFHIQSAHEMSGDRK